MAGFSLFVHILLFHFFGRMAQPLFILSNLGTNILQIFFLCVILGLFHGLLFLPVALILLGKDNGDDDGDDNDMMKIKGMKNMGFNLNEVSLPFYRVV